MYLQHVFVPRALYAMNHYDLRALCHVFLSRALCHVFNGVTFDYGAQGVIT